ncbi:hypothetical protein CSC94_22595 [Zhengella mangrovi]|uniref:Anthrax toxin edema factor central domain-containing protein n=1 Tax=Zhengella mangrovi TaxID=1982044 RepID=A0A2G1QH52_9HYPH|nr:anthrax toxin-like adenylyl cyclase domain-containing protein [Zhengella mangrovi]PHP64791.1 hypothetical protein CSC94_22595 [Zhengella mangrovi]
MAYTSQIKAFLTAVLMAFVVAGHARASQENITAFNSQLEQRSRAAVSLVYGSSGSICSLKETTSRPVWKNKVSWLLAYRCSAKSGKTKEAISVQIKIVSHTFDHPTMSIQRWKNFMVDESVTSNDIDQKKTSWLETPGYIAQIKQRWLLSKRPGKAGNHTVWLTAQAKSPFHGYLPENMDFMSNDAIAVRVSVEINVSAVQVRSISPAPPDAALTIADHILAGLGGGMDQPELSLFDANPIHTADGKTLPADLQPSELLRASEMRKGVATDGVTALLVKAELGGKAKVRFALEGDMPGTIEPLLDGRTVAFDGRSYAFALYTAPGRFSADENAEGKDPTAPPEARLGGVVEMREIKIAVFIGDSDVAAAELPVKLVRPPVVLVHGLAADPLTTWVDTFNGGTSMAHALETAGFLTFLVNYEKTNGMWDTSETSGGSWLRGSLPDSTFAANRSVVWESPIKAAQRAAFDAGWFESKPVAKRFDSPEAIRIAGISGALRYYREDLGIAATQATVIGHSMGGLLSRVWASDRYNPDYRAPRNFGAGDIYRLVTLNTPHHGSEVPELKDAIADAMIEDEPWFAWARRELVTSGLNFFLDPEPGAVTDLRPGSAALKRIGPTRVPSLAIATTADPGQFNDPEADPLSLYNSLYALAGTIFFQNQPLLDQFVRSRYYRWRNTAAPFRNETDWRGETPLLGGEEPDLAAFAAILRETLDSTAHYWARKRDAETDAEILRDLETVAVLPFGYLRPQMGNDDDLEILIKKSASKIALGVDAGRYYDESKTDDVPRAFMAMLHDLVFHNDPRSDGVVKLTSQYGGAVEHAPIPSVLHSYSPWHPEVQKRLITALKWQPGLFDPEGFPEAGELTPRFLPGRQFTDARVAGERAIRWSGMVPAHAAQYLKIADRRDAIVLVRPVNADSTGLLADNAAAKGMNVKGKSSNWGPQSGYIPVNQRYSKIWRMFRDPSVRKAMIDEYNEKVTESTTTDHPDFQGEKFAMERALTVVNNEGESCAVLNDSEGGDAENDVILKCRETYYDWRNSEKNGQPAFDPSRPLEPSMRDEKVMARLRPLLVLADPTQVHKPYLTADYDLLAIGFRDFDGDHGPPEDVAGAEFDKVRGIISNRQWDLVDEINRAVQGNACYQSGQVTHHGPENQYPKSPYVDYPVLVFDPRSSGDDTDGIAYLVRQGPPGFRDIHLKRLFEEKIAEGFDLWPNPVSKGWQWEKRRKFDQSRGYDPRDAGNLLVYVTEAPEPSAEREPVRFDEDCSRIRPSKTGAARDEPVQSDDGGGKETAAVEQVPVQSDTPMAKEMVAQNDAPPADLKTQAEPDPVEPAPKDQSPPTASDTELAVWNDVKDSRSVDELKVYLEMFPDGVFAPLARLRIKRMGNRTTDTAGNLTGRADSEPKQPPTALMDKVFSSDGHWLKILARPNGDFIIAGAMKHDTHDDPLPWIGRISREGEHVWGSFLEPGAPGFVMDLLEAEDGEFLVVWSEGFGGTQGSVSRLGRYRDDGSVLWTTILGKQSGGYGWVHASLLANGNIVAGGPLGKTRDRASGVVVMLDAHGKVVWTTEDLGRKHERIEWLGSSGSRTAVISVFRKEGDQGEASGHLLSLLDQRGRIETSIEIDLGLNDGKLSITGAVLLNDSEFIVAGEASKYGNDGFTRAVLARINASGEPVWKLERDFARYIVGSEISPLPDGSVLLKGFASDHWDHRADYDTWVARYSLAGKLLDETFLGEVGQSDYVYGMAKLDDGGHVFAGGHETRTKDGKYISRPWLFTLPAPKDAANTWIMGARADFRDLCDQLAADPGDRSRPERFIGVAMKAIDTGRATDVCSRAARFHGNEARMFFNFGRVLESSGARLGAIRQYAKALEISMSEGAPHVASAKRIVELEVENKARRDLLMSLLSRLDSDKGK